ncbi:MAG: hypothetical protein IKZ43_08250, partial [Acidaminococcaceae bacterium]|nr:hypothetical protein [Acidaminococcaceae bacterium]
RNITFKNVADVTKGGTLTNGDITGGTPHDKADGSNDTVILYANTATGNEGEIHLGFAVGTDGTVNGKAVEGINAGQYTNVPIPAFNHWNTYITPTKYMLVRNGYELQNMQNNLTDSNGTNMPGNYMLANLIQLNDGNTQIKLKPIGYKNSQNDEIVFKGKFDGLNYEVQNLAIGDPSISSTDVNEGIGLFGINGGTVENVGVNTNINVNKKCVGGIVGINTGTIRNVYHTGGVYGQQDVGGIAGQNRGSSSSIEMAYNTGTITASGTGVNVGGIAGVNEGTIAQVYNTGEVGNNDKSNLNVGGIAGKLNGSSASIKDAYNYQTGDFQETQYMLQGQNNVGGIVGLVEGNNLDHYIENTFNTGTIWATNGNSGGIIGCVSPDISGDREKKVVSSYFSRGNDNKYGGTQMTDSKLRDISTFSGWSISAAGGAGTTWRIYDGQTTPLLAAFLKPKDLVKVYEYDGSPHQVPKNDPQFDDGNIKKSGQFDANWDNYANSQTDAGVVNMLKDDEDKKLLYSLQDGYDLADMKLIVQPKALTATFADISKTYDGTDAATLTLDTLSGILDADRTKLAVGTTSATYSDKNVGENKTVTYAGLTLSGDKAENYVIQADGTGVGTISPKQLTVTFNPIRKTYDGTVNDVDELGYVVASRKGTLSGVVAGEEKKVSVSGTATYADKNASNSDKDPDKTVYYSGLALGAGTDGDESANYVLASTTMTAENNGRIDKANVTLTAEDVTKTYDGTTDVAKADGKLKAKDGSGIIFDSDNLSGGKFVFEDKNAGDGNKTVKVSSGSATITDKDTGADTSGNYNITYEDNKTSTIKKADVTLTAEDVEKTYDGTTDIAEASIKLKVKSGMIFTGDSVSGGVFAFEDKNAGTGKVVTVSGATISDGTNSGNYNITYENNTTSTINKADVTLTAEDVKKTYDGTTDVAEASRKLKVKSGTIFTGDSASGGVFAFEDKNAGTGKVVTVSGATISDGTNSGNYNISYENNTTSTIDPKVLTATFADISKTYDGTTEATAGAGTLKGVEAVDAGKVSVSALAAYDQKDAGTRTVNYTGVTLTGDEANNYSIETTTTGAGVINRKALELVADSVTIQEGAATPATFTGSVTGFVAGETIGSGDTLRFALSDPSATTAGSYGITGTLNGSASGDYGLNYTFSNAASNANAFVITAKPASVEDVTVSDLIPDAKGTAAEDIKITEVDDAMEQASDKEVGASVGFAVSQGILQVDMDRGSSFENTGMEQPSFMTTQEVAEQVSTWQENAGELNAAVDMGQKTDEAVDTEERKREKEAAENE